MDGCFSDAEKSLSLNLTAHYSPSWKTWEGIRELVQNWHDGVFSSLEKLQNVSGTCTSSCTSKVAFLSCRQDESLVYKAVLSARNSFVDEEKADQTHSLDQSFGGSVDQKTTASDVELGKIVYFPSKEKLSLINHNTELMRKVLLLGYSKKTSNKEVIGQFGEGLKGYVHTGPVPNGSDPKIVPDRPFVHTGPADRTVNPFPIRSENWTSKKAGPVFGTVPVPNGSVTV